MSFDFSGKRALVTGGTKGIGRNIVVDLQKSGAEVWAVGRSKELLHQLEKEFPKVHGVCLDITNWDETKKVLGELGPFDLLVNNAGVFTFNMFLDASAEEFDKVFTCNVKALVCVTQAVASGMVKRGEGGVIVNISSALAQKGGAGFGIYSGSKGAVDAMARVLAVELAPHKIRVNTVSPIAVLTDMAKDLVNNPEAYAAFKATIPLGRLVEPQEVSNAVLFLLSDKSAMIDGSGVRLDGGQLA